jgi:ribosomal protein S18 acetylase RimI-like enzyme
MMTSELLVQEVFDADNELFRKSYRIYEKAFRPELAQDRSVFVRNLVIKQQGILPDQDQHVVVALVGSDVIGMAVVYYFHKCNTGFIEYIVLDRRWQQKGLGARLYANLVDILKADAKRQGKLHLDAVLYEVEKAELAATQAQRRIDLSRIKFFESVGGKIVKVKYYQPPLRKGLCDVEMNLMVHIVAPALTVTHTWLLAAVDCIYTNVYMIESGLTPSEKKRYLDLLASSITGDKSELRAI